MKSLNPIAYSFKHKIWHDENCLDVNIVDSSVELAASNHEWIIDADPNISKNPVLCVDVMGINTGDCIIHDSIAVDLVNGDFYGGNHPFSALPKDIQNLIKWYQNQIDYGGNKMGKKAINEAISDDIQKLANDLTKKREMEKANSSARDIAKKLGVKLPKSKK